YLADPWYLGCTVGRFANRLSAKRVRVGTNNFELIGHDGDKHCLHGGPEGFHRQAWQIATSTGRSELIYTHVDAHNTCGFPGRISAEITYRVAEPGQLIIDYAARTDRPTVLSMTHHGYFNLHGNGKTVDGHILQIDADSYLPVDTEGIPIGDIADITGTTFDLRQPRLLTPEDRYDTCFVLNEGADALRTVASVHSPVSGITMAVHTTQLCMQLYTSDMLGEPFGPRRGLCLETQHYVDAPNQPAFPSAELTADQVYRHRTVYSFVMDPRT
ncbi:MAG: aldose epimerase family protein, partial [Pseudomonadota bacterium]